MISDPAGPGGPIAMDDTIYKLTNQLIDCQDGRSKLNGNIERLQTDNEQLRIQIVEMEQHHETALNNAYGAGYDAGMRDGRWFDYQR